MSAGGTVTFVPLQGRGASFGGARGPDGKRADGAVNPMILRLDGTSVFDPYKVHFEGLVRQFVAIDSFRTPRVPAEPPPVEPEAFIRWGGPSAFSYDDSFRDIANGGVRFDTDDDPDEDPELVYSETGRSTTDVRVENPDDPDQFVIVQKVQSMSLSGPGGRKIKFQFSG